MHATGDQANSLSTPRLALRTWRADEASRLFDIRRRPDVAQWLGDPTPWADESIAAEKIGEWHERTTAPGPLGIWAIDSGHELGPHGTVSLGFLPGSDEIEIGWYLHPDSVGQGFASEAASAILRRVLANGVDQIWAIMWPQNQASAKVALSIGMTDLGVLNDDWYGTPEEPTSRMFVAKKA